MDVDDQTATRTVLRRAFLALAPERRRSLEQLGLAALLDQLDPTVTDPLAGAVIEVPSVDNERWEPLPAWWLQQMIRPDAGIHETLVWYWHTHFPSSLDKCPPVTLARQQATIRRHALGNFRTLVRELVVDPAMLLYLDGNGSAGDAPNENLSRELMELFVMGRGGYGEADVRAGARALSGWWVDSEAATAERDPDRVYPGAIEFLGHRGRFSPADIADIVCDQPSCATHVARRLATHLIGSTPADDRVAAWAETFAAADLELAPLVADIVRTPELADPTAGRVRTPLEWFLHALLALGHEPQEEHVWWLASLGQAPFDPPNVAGWPLDDRWVSASQTLVRAQILFGLAEDSGDFGFDEADPVPQVLDRCGLTELTDATRATLDAAYWAPLDARSVGHLLLHLALLSPEFAQR